MAGPADYGKISGPLGGATFLNADDYNAGSLATERLAGTYDRAVQRAETTRNMANTNTLNEQKIQENQGVLKDQEEIRRRRSVNAEVAARRMGMGQRGSAQDGVQPPVATQSQVRAIDNSIEAQPQAVASAPMPVAAPEAVSQTVEITGNRMTPAEKDAYDAANPQVATQSQVREIDNAIDAQQQAPAPMPAVSAASSVPPPAPVAQGGAAPAPAVKAPDSSSAFDPDSLRKEYLDAQKGPAQDDIKILKEMVDEGKITPEEAGGMFEALKADRIKNVNDRVAFEKKIQDIVTSDVDNGTKRVALRIAEQEFKANTAFSLLQTYNDLGPEAATLAAQNAGLDIDFNDPKQVNALMSEAAQSKKFADLKTKQEAAKKVETKDLPDGYFRVGPNDPQVYKMENGKAIPVSTDEVARVAKQKAGAAGGIVIGEDGKQKFPANTSELLKEVAKKDAERLDAIQGSNRAAVGIINRMEDIKREVTDPVTGLPRKDLNLGPGGGVTTFLERIGWKESTPEKTAARVKREAVMMLSAETELVASNRMKGQGQLTDSERAILRKAAAGDIGNFTAEDWIGFANAQQKLQRATIEANNSEVDTLQERNKDVPLDTFRGKVPEHSKPPEQGKDAASLRKKWGAK